MPNPPSPERDLKKMYGLRQKPGNFIWNGSYNAYNTPTCYEILGSQLGADIQFVQDRFPRFYAMVHHLGWSDAEILQMTYFTACFLDASLWGWEPAWPYRFDSFTRCKIKIPDGVWFASTELRSPFGLIEGCGTSPNFGNGGTNITFAKPQWKSLYGPQQNNTYCLFTTMTYAGEGGQQPWSTGPPDITWYQVDNPTPPPGYSTGDYPAGDMLPLVLAPGGAVEWSHSTMFRNMRLIGDADNNGFYDSGMRECGIHFFRPGETCNVEDVYFTNFNDFGLLVSSDPAPFRLKNCSFFNNHVAGVGLRGTAITSITLNECSGDWNPWMVYMFQQGETQTAPEPGVPFWPTPWGATGPAGGSVALNNCKIESNCSDPNTGLPGGTGSTGKGQMMARLTGRFNFSASGGHCYVHDGRVASLLQVNDAYFSTSPAGAESNIPLNNSCVSINEVDCRGYENWMHLLASNQAFPRDPNFTPGQDIHAMDFFWQNFAARNPKTGTAISPVSALWQGRQPFINYTQGGLDFDLDNPPTFNYDVITGTPY